VGDSVVAGEKTDVKPGNAMLLSQMPVGTIIHNVEMKPGKAARSPVRRGLTPSSSVATAGW
jgi:large subunit ribosomal protein L2